MDLSELITSLLSQIWRLWSAPSPFFGLTFSQIFIGFLVIRFTIRIFRFIFVPDLSGSKDKGSDGQND